MILSSSIEEYEICDSMQNIFLIFIEHAYSYGTGHVESDTWLTVATELYHIVSARHTGFHNRGLLQKGL